MSSKQIIPRKRQIPAIMKNKNYEIKINLPDDSIKHRLGNGEGIWAIPINLKDYLKWNDDSKFDTIKVMLLNDSLYYPTLTWGSVIEVELRGDKRPVLSSNMFNYLQENCKEN